MATKFGVLKGDIIASLGKMVHQGTASGGAAGTLIDNPDLNYPDDYLNDRLIYIHDGACQGQERRITNSVQSTYTVEVTPDWVGDTPDTTSLYYIYHEQWNNAAYEAAFKQALRLLRQYFLIPDEDVTKTLGDPNLAASYTVDVPTGMVAIHRIIREHSTEDGLYTIPWPGPNETKSPWWNVSLDGTTYKIVLDYDHQLHNAAEYIMEGRDLKIIGQKQETEPTDDDSEITINPGPLIELTCQLLTARTLPTMDERANAVYIVMNRLLGQLRNLGSGIWPGSVIVENS